MPRNLNLHEIESRILQVGKTPAFRPASSWLPPARHARARMPVLRLNLAKNVRRERRVVISRSARSARFHQPCLKSRDLDFAAVPRPPTPAPRGELHFAGCLPHAVCFAPAAKAAAAAEPRVPAPDAIISARWTMPFQFGWARGTTKSARSEPAACGPLVPPPWRHLHRPINRQW